MGLPCMDDLPAIGCLGVGEKAEADQGVWLSTGTAFVHLGCQMCVASGTPRDVFFLSANTCTHASDVAAVKGVLERGQGTLVANMDIKSAYRNVPVHGG